MFAEVKAWQSYYSGGTAGPTPPASGSDIANYAGTAKMGLNVTDNKAHTEWGDGKCQQTGFTTVFTPNTNVSATYSGVPYDVDYINSNEGAPLTVPTYASLTSCSYHFSCVNVALMDGSVRTVADDIALTLWQCSPCVQAANRSATIIRRHEPPNPLATAAEPRVRRNQRGIND